MLKVCLLERMTKSKFNLDLTKSLMGWDAARKKNQRSSPLQVDPIIFCYCRTSQDLRNNWIERTKSGADSLHTLDSLG